VEKRGGRFSRINTRKKRGGGWRGKETIGKTFSISLRIRYADLTGRKGEEKTSEGTGKGGNGHHSVNLSRKR